MKTHWKKCFNKDYLGSWDLDSKEIQAVIEKVETRELTNPKGAKEKRNVAIFKGVKPMVLNVTNCKLLTKLSGSNYIEDWKNIPVTIYVDKVEAFGDMVDALRLKAGKKKEKLTPKHPKWKDAVDYLKKPNSKIDGIKKGYDISENDIAKLEEEAML